jgi:hypothetical protein
MRCENVLAMSLRLLPLPLAVLALGCSALIEPDETRLGGEDPRMDGGRDRDAGTSDDDGGPTPRRDAGRDAGCTTPVECTDGVLRSCAGEMECEHGCAPSGEPRCALFVPSNVSETLWREDAGDLTIAPAPDAILFDTDACALEGVETSIVAQDDARELCVLSVGDFTIETGAYWLVFGSRPIVIMASGDVEIEADAVLDASGHGVFPGPGGGLGGRLADFDGEGEGGGRRGEHIAAFSDGGGGGGGFSGSGGPGGGGATADGGEGGERVDTDQLIPLRGGSGGGLG